MKKFIIKMDFIDLDNGQTVVKGKIDIINANSPEEAIEIAEKDLDGGLRRKIVKDIGLYDDYIANQPI